jgi:hypothetical protein
MRKTLTKLFSVTMVMAIVSFAGCGDDSSPTPSPTFEFPSNSVTLSKVYDINNNGSATDIRVDFKISKNEVLQKIEEVRLIVSKTTLTIDQAKALASDRYLTVSKPTDLSVIGRFTTAIKDTEGSEIVNDVVYKVYVVLKNSNAYALSNSLNITLKDKPIYAGQYKGVWNDKIFPNFKVSMILHDDYTGDIFYSENYVTCCPAGEKNDAAAKFVISGTTITSFEAKQFLPNYAADGCPATYTATGTIPNEITLSLTGLAGTDCDGNHAPGTIVFTRQ